MPGILPTEADNITKQAPPCVLHTFCTWQTIAWRYFGCVAVINLALTAIGWSQISYIKLYLGVVVV